MGREPCTRAEARRLMRGAFPVLCFCVSPFREAHNILEPDGSCSPVLWAEGPWLSVSRARQGLGASESFRLGTESPGLLGETSRLC